MGRPHVGHLKIYSGIIPDLIINSANFAIYFLSLSYPYQFWRALAE